jgi:predicted nuclease with TOPRIM domain
LGDEIVQLKEEISALVHEKEEFGRERSEVKHSLENVSVQLETVGNELAVFKVGVHNLIDEVSPLSETTF